jgi:uncharacterized protein (DUF1015 family)
MKVMPKDEIVETYVKIINKIIDDLMFGMHESDRPDSFNYLYGKKRVLELIMGIDNVDEGEDDVSKT